MKKFPIGVQDFESLITDGYVYVDKTSHIYNLAQNGSYYFLGRPRRFGKSLLLSTLKAYFLGKKELFKGLAIEKLETRWESYPVLYLDINSGNYKVQGELDNVLNDYLVRWEKVYGSEPSESTFALRFMGVIRRAAEKTGKSVVILVDEYDKPMVQTINDEELQSVHRNTLKAFYSVLKTYDRYIRFAMLTGVTKFSKVSVFSDLNNLNDISMDEEFTDCCGLTEEEIRNNFDEEISGMAAKNGLSKAECYDELRRLYDGYHFRQDSVGVYNPFSVLNALRSKRMEFYWFSTGTPTILVELLKRNNYNLNDIASAPVLSSRLDGVEDLQDNPIPLMYQSGYLTISSYNKLFRSYTLDYPNEEVKDGFLNFLLPYYTPAKNEDGTKYIQKLTGAVLNGNVEELMETLKAFFDSGDYRIQGKMELYFQNSLYVIFKLLGLYVDVEMATAKGRMDLCIKTSDYIYVMELKLDGSPQEALAQIESKGYALKFAQDSRRLFKLGVNFSSQSASIDSFLVS